MDLFSPKKQLKSNPIKTRLVSPESLESVDLSISEDESSPFANLSTRAISAKSRRRPKSTPRSGSLCNQYTKEECNPPACEYIEGEKRQYCRMSRKYQRTATGNLTRKIGKEEATEKIKNLIKRSSIFLKRVCSNSGQCVSFGKYTTEITAYFKGFTGFEYALTPISAIGGLSANGFIKEIKYERNGYNAYAILKSSRTPDADNLVYEYIVGNKFINRILKKFPCFIETYGFYFYDFDSSWKRMLINRPLNKAVLNGLELQRTIDYNKACSDSKLAALLIQHIKDARPLKTVLSTGARYSDFTIYELLYVLFIIYQALAALSTVFTHYDLHSDNILLFEPHPGKYIEYHYYLRNGTTIEFKCSYVPKMIDYGRSFFDNGNVSSKTVYEKLCKARDCHSCGYDNGFNWLDSQTYLGINSQQKNESHDLRLLVTISAKFKILESIGGVPRPTKKTFNEVNKIVNKVIYGRSIENPDNKEYGTKENLKEYSGSRKIYNITNAYEYLQRAILKPKVIAENNERFQDPINKLGDFHIYEDGRDMEYIPL